MTLAQDVIDVTEKVMVEALKDFTKVGSRSKQSQVIKKLDTVKGLVKLPKSGLKVTLDHMLSVVNKRKRFLPSKMGEFRNVSLVNFFPNPSTRSVTFRGRAIGADKNKYILSFEFYDVDFSDKKDDKHPLKIQTKSGKTYYMARIKRDRNPVQTRCNCEDFNWSFSYWDKEGKALLGQVPDKVKNYKRSKDSPRGPRNPKHLPGFCKHLYKFIPVIRGKKFLDFWVS